jgi:hypothetical protein
MKRTSISEILRRIRPLAKHHQVYHLRGVISSEQGGNIYKTSVRIRELQAALKDILNKQLKRENRSAA